MGVFITREQMHSLAIFTLPAIASVTENEIIQFDKIEAVQLVF